MKIIGISGKKGSGKDTIYRMFVDRNPDKTIFNVSFADKLREVVFDLFIPESRGLKVDDLKELEIKELQLPGGKTIREVLQLVGTDVARKIDTNCWIKAWNKKISRYYKSYGGLEENEPIIVVTDVRFPNEVEIIQERGGKVVRLLRSTSDDQHASEIALDQWTLDDWQIYDRPSLQAYMKFDAILDNKEIGIEHQYEEFVKLVNERNWI